MKMIVRNKWFVLGCCVAAINLYGVLRWQPVIRHAEVPPVPGQPPAVTTDQDSVPAAEPASEHGRRASRLMPLTLTRLRAVSPAFEHPQITLSFSHPVAIESLRQALHIEPAADVTIVRRRHWGRAAEYTVQGDLQKGVAHRVTIRKTLQAQAGALPMTEDIARTVMIPDAEAAVRIRLQGRYLSPQGNLLLPLESINVERYTLRASRLVPHNLVQFAMREGAHYRRFYGDPADALGTAPIEREFTVPAGANRIEQHSAPLRELLPEDPRGAWQLELVQGESIRARRLIVVTDTGISVKQAAGEVLVWANSIHTLAPVSNATVTVWSSAAEMLAEGRTDRHGLAALELAAGSTEPFLVSVGSGDDLSFISLRAAALRVPAGGGSTPYLTAGYEAFVYTDRGVYRPGETAHVRGIVRGPRFAMPGTFPLDLHLIRPDGRLHSRQTAILSALGTVEFEVPWADFDPTGRYRLELRSPGAETAMGQTAVAVEDFAPPRMTAELQTDKRSYAEGEAASIAVDARYLYGAPADGNPVSLRLETQPVEFRADRFADFRFGDAEKAAAPTSKGLGAGRLDRDGKAVFRTTFGSLGQPPAMVRGMLAATVMEQGGRTVSAFRAVELHPYPFYIGLRADDVQAMLPGQEAFVALVLANPDGSPLQEARSLSVTLSTVDWSTVLVEDGQGRFRYRSERRLHPVLQESVQTGVDGSGRIAITPAETGNYLLRIMDAESGASSSLAFHVGGTHDRWASRSMEAPSRVELSWDKPHYRPGETAILTVAAPFPGKALLTIEQDRVIHRQVVDMDANTTGVELRITEAMLPNAHATVSVIRPVAVSESQAIVRAYGAIPLVLDHTRSRAHVALGVPPRIRPQSTLDIDVRVTDRDGSPVRAEVAVAVVDEGICMLTDYQTPDPLEFFTALRQAAVSVSDIYAMMLPESDPDTAIHSAHTGGDVAGLLKGRLNPVRSRRFVPVALWRSGVMTDDEGCVTVSLDVPEFSGQLRVMAVAVGPAQFGSAAESVTVARPFTVLASLPRFLAPGDTSELSVSLNNQTDLAGETALDITTEGPLQLVSPAVHRVTLAANGQATLALTVKAAERTGAAAVIIRGTLGEERVTETINLPIRPDAPEITLAGTITVPAGESRELSIPDNWLPGSAESTVTVSERATIALKGGLDYLVRYPYGCLEQTISGALPLLYLNDLPASEQATFAIGDLSPLIESGVDRVLGMQAGNGGFTYWPHSSSRYDWGSINALHFLAEARKAGYQVPDERLQAAVDYAQALLNRPVDNEDLAHTLALRAYGCYALALAGHPQHDRAERLREQLAVLDADSRLYLTLALAAGGRRRDAWALLPALDNMPLPETRQLGGSLMSPARTAALTLMAWVELSPEDARIPDLVRRLEGLTTNGAWHTTQENAVALMAISRYLRATASDAGEYNGWMEQDGQRIRIGSAHARRVTPVRIAPVTLINEGPGRMVGNWQVRGIPTGDARVADHDHRLAIRRDYLTLDQAPADGNCVRQGELLVVRLRIDTFGERIDNIVIDELLPAGLEIENASLKTSQIVEWARRLNTLPVRHHEVRDDRLVVFAEAFSGVREYYYAVRAVTPGRYVRPAVSAFAMYDPAIASRHGAGELVVTHAE